MSPHDPTGHVDSGLADPPDDPSVLADLPQAPAPAALHRVSEHRHGWYFHAVADPTRDPGGRFDLATRGQGTCHVGETLDGALCEKLLRAPIKVVPAQRLAELHHTVGTVHALAPVADLTAHGATGFGVNSELHATLDYAVPRRWAHRLWQAGWRALRYLLRADPSGQTAGVALFGGAGLHRRAPLGRARPAARSTRPRRAGCSRPAASKWSTSPPRSPFTSPPTMSSAGSSRALRYRQRWFRQQASRHVTPLGAHRPEER